MYICAFCYSKSLQRVYYGTFWQHFLVKIQKMWNTQFLSSIFFCNTLQIMFTEYLEQKTMRTNIKNIFSPMFPKTMGGKYKKMMPRIFGLQKHNQHQRIKIINNKIFCSSLCVLSVGKALYLPRFRSKNSALATEATKRKWRQLTPPVKSSFTDVRKLQMWVFVSLEN